MKLSRFFLVTFSLALCSNLFCQNKAPYQFINPKPFSIMVSAETNIIIIPSSTLDRNTLYPNLIFVEGTKSGIHSGDFILSDDDKTLIFNPYKTFASEEEVSVVLKKGIKTISGDYIDEYSFLFTTAPKGINQIQTRSFNESIDFLNNQNPDILKKNGNNSTLPAPPITINSINNPSPGYIFMATWDRNLPAIYGNFIFILDSSGIIIDSVRVNGAPYDFQVQPNGLLSYALGDFSSNVPLPGEELQHIVLDSNLAFVDSFKMKNGYTTDFHEFKMLPNGHVIMMSYHTIIYDMSKIVKGGKTDANLVINIIQEQDREKNVVFEWRNIDYIPILDSDLDLTDSRINYGTLNAFDIDNDGNILASFRNHSEIIKISRSTGELLWRMGGPRGEFTFIGEHEENAPYYHSRQHNIRRRPNGNITLFDNGQFHQPPYSRAVEYSIDEINKTATMVSEWRYPNGNIFCVTAGNAELLSNGGWFIGYGVPNPQFVKRNAVEVNPSGEISLELSLPPGVLAYRAYKLPWKQYQSKPSFTNFEVRQGNTYSFNNESIITGVEIKYNSLSAADYNESIITRIPYSPLKPEFIESNISVSPVSIIYKGFAISSQAAEFHIDLAQYPEIKNPESTSIYFRNFPNQGLFLPLATTYEINENELIVILNDFGEIVFGVDDNNIVNNIPIQYEPFNEQKLILQDTLNIKWTGKGLYNSFNIQISNDSTFANILHEVNTNLSYYPIANLTNNTKYFWRVNSKLGNNESMWSDVWSFSITDPFINLLSPDEGAIWAIGNPEIIRWETNILENVRIDLLHNQKNILSLASIPGSYQAYEWNLPLDFATGENFNIKIISESDSTIFSLSENVFTIIDTITNVVEYENNVPNEYNLYQNFPNPFNPNTIIKFSIPIASNVKLRIYDLLGNKVSDLVNDFKSAGTYSVNVDAGNLASGVYIYQISTDNFVETKKMIFLK